MTTLTMHRRRTGLMALMVAMLSTLPGTAAAGTVPSPPPDSSSGFVGAHGFAQDSQASPAGRCRYGIFVGDQYFNHLYRVGVVPPEAYARPSRTSQRIGFRLIVQVFDGANWVFYAQSQWAYKMATPDTPAPFVATGVPVDIDAGGPFRAKVRLHWYAPDGTTLKGRATLFPEWYRAFERDLPPHEQHYDCGTTTG